MSFDVPTDCLYLETHEWLRRDGDTAWIGLTDFAQDELGDVVFVELPDEGDELAQEESFGVVESIKAVSDVYAPASGTVIDTNESLETTPELVNDDPYGDGWFCEIELTDVEELDGLLDADAYRDQIA